MQAEGDWFKAFADEAYSTALKKHPNDPDGFLDEFQEILEGDCKDSGNELKRVCVLFFSAKTIGNQLPASKGMEQSYFKNGEYRGLQSRLFVWASTT
ncbi:MAG: hypothetical protein AAFY31_14795 [Pseudomonadota bacterium]